MVINGRVLTSLFMLVLFATMALLAVGFPAKAGFVPLLIGIPGALLCFAQLVSDLRHPEGEPEPPGKRGTHTDIGGGAADTSPEAARRERVMFAWLVGFTVALLGFGFLVGGPLIVFAYLRFGERESWFNAVFGGVGTFLVIWAMFVWLLELPIFDGLLLERLGA